LAPQGRAFRARSDGGEEKSGHGRGYDAEQHLVRVPKMGRNCAKPDEAEQHGKPCRYQANC